MSKIDELIESFHENIGCATGEDGNFLLYQFEEIKNLYYGKTEEAPKYISKEDQEKIDEETQKFYDVPGYKGD